jgi:two-component system chemotaxis response regulator CheB
LDKIRVLIVDDSSFVRKALTRIFEAEQGIEIVGSASDGGEAIEKLATLSPDVVTLDIMMPGMDGIATLRRIMEIKPTPVLMLSQHTHEGAELTLNALDLGAMDFVDKSSTGLMDIFGLGREIVSKVRAIAGSKPLNISPSTVPPEKYGGNGIVDVVAIATSTGGPSALQVILPKFPKEIKFGILVVQHMPAGFTGPLAQRLDSICHIRVKEAEEGENIKPGVAFVAPSGLHMKMKEGHVSDDPSGRSCKITLDAEPASEVHRPSADVLFSAVAKHYGSRSIGVILTGMGSDGVKGMGEIKEEGGFTIAQDEATSAIFGMPRVAIANKVVAKVLPITSIAEEILRRA